MVWLLVLIGRSSGCAHILVCSVHRFAGLDMFARLSVIRAKNTKRSMESREACGNHFCVLCGVCAVCGVHLPCAFVLCVHVCTMFLVACAVCCVCVTVVSTSGMLSVCMELA